MLLRPMPGGRTGEASGACGGAAGDFSYLCFRHRTSGEWSVGCYLAMTMEGKISLLIAEDDPQTRFLVETAAERAGVFDPIVTVADGEAALLAVRREAPNRTPGLIVSDLSMPRMTGLELIRALKSDPVTRFIPIAIITSSDLPYDRDDALAAGACAFEPKPYGLEALTQLLLSLRRTCCETTAATGAR